MCGKFTAMASWAQVVAFSQPLTMDRYQNDNNKEVTFRVVGNLNVIVWDAEKLERRVLPMRWGFPDPKDWRRPKPIHARAESIETTRAFAQPFVDGQRGIVLFKTFNEAPDVEGPTQQYTVKMGDAWGAGFAFVWRRFDIEGIPTPMLACVMVTVPANALIATLPADRMPAILDNDDWAKWLGQEPATPGEVKACLKTQEGVRWTMTREERAAKAPRRKPSASNPTGLDL